MAVVLPTHQFEHDKSLQKNKFQQNNWESGPFSVHPEIAIFCNTMVKRQSGLCSQLAIINENPDWRRTASLVLYPMVFQNMEISVLGAQSVN